VDSTIRVGLTGVNFEPAVPVPLYRQERPRSPSRSPSPTRSQVCNTLTKEEPFEIDKDWIKINFMGEHNKQKRDWYFSTFNKKLTDHYLKEFYDFLNYHETNINFFTWFKLYCLEYEIPNPYTDKMFLDTNTRMTTQWKTSNKDIIISTHPPLEPIMIKVENMELEAAPFKTIKNPDQPPTINTRKDFYHIHTQLNYTNQTLNTIAQQLSRIEGILPMPKEEVTTKLDPNRPIYKYEVPSKTTVTKMKLGPEEKIDELILKLNKMNLASSSTINTLSQGESSINRLGPGPQPRTRNFYPRPSFADVQFEERFNFVENSYSGQAITKWNIDGASEQHVLYVIG
jgi:hypothetical protein